MIHTILMLEADEDDRYITQAVINENHSNVNISFVSNSEDLMQYLLRCSEKRMPLPSLILLEYHAIPSNAVEILKALKSNAVYKHIPVVVLSGSVQHEMVRECYSNGASSFIQKPSEKIETKISNFIRYWFETVQFA